MATAPIYCTHKELKRVFPQINEFDNKIQVLGWESLGNNVYVSHDTGLVSQLYVDGKELSSANVLSASGTTYKTRITSTLENAAENQETFNLVNYNASFITGSESDMQVGDYVAIFDGGGVEYLYIESINAGANQINVRRGALGTTIQRHPTGGVTDPGFQDVLRVDELNHWFYDEYYDQVLMYSTTTPNDKLVEAGEDFTTMVTQFRTDASRYLDSKLDPNLPANQFKDKSGNFDYMIIRTTALLCASLMIRASDPTSEMASAFMAEAQENVDALNNGKAGLSWQNTSDSSKGVVRDVGTVSGTVRPVDTRGRYSGTYDLIKIKIDTTGGIIGTATYSVWVTDGDKLGMNEGNQVVTTEIINGDYQSLAGGLQVRFSGTDFDSTATVNDTWEVEVQGWTEEVDSNTLKPIRMTRRF